MNKLFNRKFIALACAIGLLLFFFHFQNNSLVINEHKLISKKLPASFDNFKIVQLSDLHNKSFGKDQEKLVSKIKTTNPDIIVITGDIVDSRRYDPEPSLALVTELVKLTHVYYVTGNHEARIEAYPALESQLIEAGVSVLRNSTEVFYLDKEKILITGIDDPTFHAASTYMDDSEHISDNIVAALEDNGNHSHFNLLLSHRPEALSLYATFDFDLVFSGHAHGGQIRLPFIGGLIAPDQGFFPPYTSGMHTIYNTSMIVNRGLGNSLFPFRVFNRPEIVVLTLEAN